MQESQGNEIKSKLKLAQLWHIVKHADQNKRTSDLYKNIVDNIIKDNFNVNYRVTIKNESQLLRQCLKDCTALHFVFYEDDIDTFNKLLKHGADYTAKNGKGDTVIHAAINSENVEQTMVFVESVLSAHVEHQNYTNPQNNVGISHLHGSCIVNHVESLKQFLEADKSGTLINQITHPDLESYPSFTPLHFAALHESFDSVQILMSRGANVSVENGFGMTPLDECLHRRLSFITRLSFKGLDETTRQTYEDKLHRNEMIIKLLLDSKYSSAIDFSRLHVASTLEDLSIAKNLLRQSDVDINYVVPKNSPFRPGYQGYTAAHFAVLNNIEAVKILLRHGAKLEAKDSRGDSVLDVCLQRFDIKDVYEILASHEDWNNQTLLLNFLRASADVNGFKLFLKNVDEDTIVPSDSLLWQGYTILHLAVTIAKEIKRTHRVYRYSYETRLVKECLEVGQMSVDVQNSRGQSAIHLAFTLGKINILKLLLKKLNSQEKVEDVVNQDNLSYLHIACAQKNESLIKKLLQTSNPNVIYKGSNYNSRYYILTKGSTPLHIAASNGSFEIVQMLLERGANLHAVDCYNTTPIHCTMMSDSPKSNDRKVADVLFHWLLKKPRDCVNDTIGLSYLHVASFYGDVKAVKKLIEIGSNVNAVICLDNKSLSFGWLLFPELYTTFRPLHLAQINPVDEVIDLLIHHGADVFAISSNKSTEHQGVNSNFPLEHKNIMWRFMSILWDRDDMQKSIERKLGLTRLHIACYLKNEKSVRNVLKSEAFNINARICEDSKIFAGYTPLHMLLRISHKVPLTTGIIRRKLSRDLVKFTVIPILQLLLSLSADVTIMDSKNNTPIHLLYKYQRYFTNVEQCADLLLNAHINFSVNLTNENGMSHFHLACYWRKVEVMKKFLQQGSVDVNCPIDFFAKTDAGATPLHLALNLRSANPHWSKIADVVNLLIEYKANVTVEDVSGLTPLQTVLQCCRQNFTYYPKPKLRKRS